MITKLYELSGAAMVFGKERTITWKREGGLMIEALSHDEVMKILAAVAGPTQPGVPEVARPVPSFEESDSAEPPFDGGKPIDTSFPPVDALAPVPVKASKIEASDRPGELPLSGGPKSLPAKDVSAPALQTAENLATVLTFLKNKGFTEWKTMFDECVRIRADVPLLAKVKDDDFKDRLLRVMATKLQMAVPDDA